MGYEATPPFDRTISANGSRKNFTFIKGSFDENDDLYSILEYKGTDASESEPLVHLTLMNCIDEAWTK